MATDIRFYDAKTVGLRMSKGCGFPWVEMFATDDEGQKIEVTIYTPHIDHETLTRAVRAFNAAIVAREPVAAE